MSLGVIRSLLLCAMGLLSETLCSLSLEAETGDKVTIWCQHDVVDTGYIYWFKHTIDSVPLRIGCKHVKISGQTETCNLFSESSSVMSVHGKNTSLTIPAVNVSDTGLYYCGYVEHVETFFSKSSYLKVKDRNMTLYKKSDIAKGLDSSAVFFMLTVVFGAVIVVLFCVLIVIKLKQRKPHIVIDNDAKDNKDEASDPVNYVALQFSNKKTKTTRRHGENDDPHVVYSSIR